MVRKYGIFNTGIFKILPLCITSKRSFKHVSRATLVFTEYYVRITAFTYLLAVIDFMYRFHFTHVCTFCYHTSVRRMQHEVVVNVDISYERLDSLRLLVNSSIEWNKISQDVRSKPYIVCFRSALIEIR